MRPSRSCVLALIAGAALLIGCGDDDDSSPEAQSDRPSIVAEAEAKVEQLYKGTHEPPPTSAPAPEPGKHVWAISVGNQAIVAAEAAEAFKTGAERLGWKATVVDGKFDPNLWLEGIRQAVAARADGIWLVFFDCAPVRAGLEAAKRADIPVIASAGFDCNADDPGSPSLFTWETPYVEGTFPDFQAAWGEAQAYWTIANTDGKAKVLSFIETDLKGTLIIGQEFEKTMRRCPDCEILETVEFTGRDFGPALQQKTEQALLANPDADVVYANYDGPVTAGIGAAVRASGRDLLVIGGEGLAPNLDLIREGRQGLSLGYVAGWEAYAALDALVRIFAGERPSDKTGLGVQLTDAEHNLPPAGEPYDPGVDWQGLYERAWGVD